MTKTAPVEQRLSMEAPCSPLSSRPKRTRISYFALLATTTCAALRKESRMKMINATGLDRKSGGAKWRDLRCQRSLLGNVLSTERRRRKCIENRKLRSRCPLVSMARIPELRAVARPLPQCATRAHDRRAPRPALRRWRRTLFAAPAGSQFWSSCGCSRLQPVHARNTRTPRSPLRRGENPSAPR